MAAPAASFLGCAAEEPAEDASANLASPELLAGDVVRPILRAWSDEAVWLDAPARELPVAYVSMSRMQLFLDSTFHDQVYWDLRAHISVSTGVWRIPLVGDPPTMAIVPGDVRREFEPLSEREWDPTEPPALGDIRITRGTAASRRVELVCAPYAGPLTGDPTWLRAGPYDITQSTAPVTALVREDFGPIGTGMRFADRDCTRPRGEVDILTWSVLPVDSAAIGAGG
jgi:hypothetical protein